MTNPVNSPPFWKTKRWRRLGLLSLILLLSLIVIYTGIRYYRQQALNDFVYVYSRAIDSEVHVGNYSESAIFLLSSDGHTERQLTAVGWPETDVAIDIAQWLEGISEPLLRLYISLITPSLENRPLIVASSPAWSPDGKSLVYTSNGDLNIRWMDITNSEIRQFSCPITSTTHCRFKSPRWSPDGTRLAFLVQLTYPPTFEPPFEYHIAVVDFNGHDFSNFIILTDYPDTPFTWNTSFDWSPDGSQIAFVVKSPNFRLSQIFLVASDGKSEPISLTGKPDRLSFVDMRWSPDGTSIVFVAGEEHYFQYGDLYLLDVTTGLIRNLTNTPLCLEGNPSWSPPGDAVYFMSDCAGGTPETTFVPNLNVLYLNTGEIQLVLRGIRGGPVDVRERP